MNSSLSLSPPPIAHGGHFHSPSEMREAGPALLLTLMAVSLAAQATIALWQRYRRESFDRVALLALWLVPAALAFNASLHLELLIWSTYSALSMLVLYRVFVQKPMARDTPRLVYLFFERAFQCCYVCTTAGYTAFLFDLFLLPPTRNVSHPHPHTDALPSDSSPIASFGIAALLYGLYFGVLSRDLCSFCQANMVARLGLVKSPALSLSTCALCGLTLPTNEVTEQDRGPTTLSLECRHSFHTSCIRGWSMVGKRDVCPTCNEKVELKSVVGANPWERQLLLWKSALDATRFLLVLTPIVLFTTQAALIVVW